MSLRTLYHPEIFQGSLSRRNYFEGWYFKQVSADNRSALSVIPGVSLASDRHAFIQVIDGISGQTHYIDFPVASFNASKSRMEIRIGDNYFSPDKISLDIDRDGLVLKGNLRFSGRVPWPGRLWSPGIMGWYGFVPRMECYHGVVSLDHTVDGEVTYQDGLKDFNGGRGYIEKDWGTSMPERWIWLHTNTFDTAGTSVMLSIAKIPWLGSHFTGFIAFVLHQGKLYRFATYNGSRILSFRLKDQHLAVMLDGPDCTLEIEARQKVAGKLKAPVNGLMERYIKESIDSEVDIRLTDHSGMTLFSGSAKRSGLELVGNPEVLFPET